MIDQDLPAAWRAAIRFCPFCAGQGCTSCHETGDLFGALLIEAYRKGEESVIDGLRRVEEVRRHAVETVRTERPSQTQLKQRMGL